MEELLPRLSSCLTADFQSITYLQYGVQTTPSTRVAEDKLQGSSLVSAAMAGSRGGVTCRRVFPVIDC